MLLRRILGQALRPASRNRLYISGRVAGGDRRLVVADLASSEHMPVSHSRPPLPRLAPSPRPASASAIGTRLVLGLVFLALGLAGFAVWFQWGQTRRCLAFYGPAVARAIQAAPRVELWSLAADRAGVRATPRLEISRAAGLVHLRRGLLEDVNFRWDATDGRLPPGAWDEAIAFFATAEASTPAAVVAFDLDEPGFATVVGRPGRIILGPIAPGLRKWISATKSGFSPRKSGF